MKSQKVKQVNKVIREQEQLQNRLDKKSKEILEKAMQYTMIQPHNQW